MSLKIGKIISVDNFKIKVDVLKKYIASFAINDGKAIRIGGVSNILRTSNFIYQVISEEISESKDSTTFEHKILICDLLGYINNGEYFEGTNGDMPNIYDSVYSTDNNILLKVYSNIDNIKDDNEETNSNVNNNKTIEIGYYSLMNKIKFKFDINNLYASHILIVGNTGSGKSNTLAKLYEELFATDQLNFSKSKFLFIDTNGEFEQSFTDNDKIKKIIDVADENNGLKIPIQYLDENNWGLILDATKKTQFPVIRSVIRKVRNDIFKKNHHSSESSNLVKNVVQEYIETAIHNIISSQIQPNQRILTLEKIIENKNELLYENSIKKYKEILSNYKCNGGKIIKGSDPFTDKANELEDKLKETNLFYRSTYSVKVFAYLLHLEYLTRVYKYNISESNISPMISRMENKVYLLEKYLIPFESKKTNSNKNFDTSSFIDSLFSVKNEKNKNIIKPILILNMEKCNRDLSILFVSLLGEKMFDYALEKKKNNKRGSYHFIIEEAHNYLSKNDSSREDALYDNCQELFEKIIKEGRKYGMFMTISTQRPSEINETIVSQTHNFFIHKIINPKDLSIIKSAVPFLDELSYKMLPILSPGQCIATGTAFKKTNIVKIDEPTLKVDSKTINLIDLWNEN